MEPKKITQKQFWSFYKSFRAKGGNCACVGTNFEPVNENGIKTLGGWVLEPDSALTEVIYHPDTELFKITPKGQEPRAVTFFVRVAMEV